MVKIKYPNISIPISIKDSPLKGTRACKASTNRGNKYSTS